MKLTIFFFVTVCALVFVGAKNDTLVNFKVSSAQLEEAIEAILIVYVLDPPVPLKVNY